MHFRPSDTQVDPKTGQVELASLFPEWRPGRDFATFALPHLHRAFLRRECRQEMKGMKK